MLTTVDETFPLWQYYEILFAKLFSASKSQKLRIVENALVNGGGEPRGTHAPGILLLLNWKINLFWKKWFPHWYRYFPSPEFCGKSCEIPIDYVSVQKTVTKIVILEGQLYVQVLNVRYSPWIQFLNQKLQIIFPTLNKSDHWTAEWTQVVRAFVRDQAVDTLVSSKIGPPPNCKSLSGKFQFCY